MTLERAVWLNVCRSVKLTIRLTGMANLECNLARIAIASGFTMTTNG